MSSSPHSRDGEKGSPGGGGGSSRGGSVKGSPGGTGGTAAGIKGKGKSKIPGGGKKSSKVGLELLLQRSVSLSLYVY